MEHQLHCVLHVAQIEATVRGEGPLCPEKGKEFVQVARERGIYTVHEVHQSADIHLHTCLANTP